MTAPWCAPLPACSSPAASLRGVVQQEDASAGWQAPPVLEADDAQAGPGGRRRPVVRASSRCPTSQRRQHVTVLSVIAGCLCIAHIADASYWWRGEDRPKVKLQKAANLTVIRCKRRRASNPVSFRVFRVPVLLFASFRGVHDIVCFIMMFWFRLRAVAAAHCPRLCAHIAGCVGLALQSIHIKRAVSTQ